MLNILDMLVVINSAIGVIWRHTVAVIMNLTLISKLLCGRALCVYVLKQMIQICNKSTGF